MTAPMDSLDWRLPVSPEPRERPVSPGAQEQKDPPVYPARRPLAFHPRKEKQKV
jgi:hypothetical protein